MPYLMLRKRGNEGPLYVGSKGDRFFGFGGNSHQRTKGPAKFLA
jgi:hypothetical protein